MASVLLLIHVNAATRGKHKRGCYVVKNAKGFSLIELLIVIVIIGIIAAIAVPSLLRARVSANEAGTIGDHRTVSSAFVAYTSANTGLFDTTLTCLSAPSGCIPSYPAAAPLFLDAAVADTAAISVRLGYVRGFTPGTMPASVPTTASPTSALFFCYHATPASQNRTGVRGFGTDGSGRLCFNPTGASVGCTATGLPAPGTATCVEVTS
jgi:type IV pilus assembly protein PilA